MAKATLYYAVVALPAEADELHEIEEGTEMTVTVISAPDTNLSLAKQIRNVDDLRHPDTRHGILTIAVEREATPADTADALTGAREV